MSKADKMFKELGYEKIGENVKIIMYKYNEDFLIKFYKKSKCVATTNSDAGDFIINMKELQAINEKVKELRVE